MDAGGQFVADARIFILFIHLCGRQLAPPPVARCNPIEALIPLSGENR